MGRGPHGLTESAHLGHRPTLALPQQRSHAAVAVALLQMLHLSLVSADELPVSATRCWRSACAAGLR
eukprot:6592600-Alexandrium_andersonii.AAC.1